MTYSAECKKCGWKGSKHKVLLGLGKYFYTCPNPKCESNDIIIYGKPQKKIKETK